MGWSVWFGGMIFWIGLIVAIILFSLKRKWAPIMYLISISLYVFTVSYIIDVYDLSKNAIMILLALSAFIMIGLGWHLSSKKKR